MSSVNFDSLQNSSYFCDNLCWTSRQEVVYNGCEHGLWDQTVGFNSSSPAARLWAGYFCALVSFALLPILTVPHLSPRVWGLIHTHKHFRHCLVHHKGSMSTRMLAKVKGLRLQDWGPDHDWGNSAEIQATVFLRSSLNQSNDCKLSHFIFTGACLFLLVWVPACLSIPVPTIPNTNTLEYWQT
jgi:hypothetical protein